MKRINEAERSIVKTYRKELWAAFVRGISDFDMIQENDHIACCISGGKDSMLMAKLFQELKRHGKIPFEVKYLVMDPGYHQKNLEQIKQNAEKLDIPIEIYPTPIFQYVTTLEKNPCYICARMRRGHLYRIAKENGCNKIALGHHFDDVIETILLSMLYAGQYQTMMPKLHSENFESMELIRPMYYIREQDILRWCNHNQLEFIRCACKFTKDDELEHFSKRKEIKELIQNLKKVNPYVEKNIFKSSQNVNISQVISYFDDNGKYHFLDNYYKGDHHE
ncbi:MAG: tRNA 2-thiocytidine biosynthesis TtcA family protein [Traorella sp.]